MKVTGWTYWDNPNYIDISSKVIDERINSMPFESFENIKKMSEDEYKVYRKKREEALEEHIKNSKLEKIIIEIEKEVRNEIAKNGYKFCGSYHQQGDYGVPIIDEKYVYQISQRDWGALIAEVYPDDDYEQYGEMKYIKWAWMDAENAKYPNDNIKLYKICNGDVISLSVEAYKSQFELISNISIILEGNIKYGIQYSSLENIIKIMITNIESH